MKRKTKKRLFLLFSLVLLLSICSMTAWALDDEELPILTPEAKIPSTIVDSGTCGENVRWTLDEEGTLTISGEGEMEDFWYDFYQPWYNYQDAIKKVRIEKGVTHIGERAFYKCANMESVEIPGSVTSIGEKAFADCTGLKSAEIPYGVTVLEYDVFNACQSMESVTIPNTVTTIKSMAFYDCQSLKSVTIPESVTTIGDAVFRYCYGLTSVTIPRNVESIGDGVFSCCCYLSEILIAEGNKSFVMDDGILYNAGKTELILCLDTRQGSVTVPNSVKSIRPSAFAFCNDIPSVTIPDSVTEIGTGCFMGAYGLESIVLPNHITEISRGLFDHCTGLRTVKIPEGVTTIAYGAFDFCDNLKSVQLPSTLTKMDSPFHYCESLLSITIPDGVTEIAKYSFANCTALETVSLGNGVKTIQNDAFYWCTSLKTIRVGAGLTSVGDRAFQRCESLTDVYYGGGENDWLAIEVGSDNDCFRFGPLVHYYYEIPKAVSGDCGESIKWMYDTSGTLSFVGSGVMADWDSYQDVPWNYRADLVQTVDVREGITTVGKYAFCNCRVLNNAVLPKSIREIGDYAFFDCPAFSDVYYAGSESDWEKIDFGRGNEALTSAIIHFNTSDTPPSPPTKTDYVARMYSICLGREPGANETEYYLWEIDDNGMTGTEVAKKFVFSDEFLTKNYCDRHYAEALYKAFMGREPSEAEIESKVYLLQQGQTREQVFNEFVTSTEYKTLCAAAGITPGEGIRYSGKGTRAGGRCSVEGCHSAEGMDDFSTRLYTVALGRQPSQEEIDAWTYYQIHGDHTAKSASKAFLFSEEFKAHNYDDATFVTYLYEAMMGRTPGSDEVEYWVWMLSSQGLTREAAFEQFAASNEFMVICANLGIVCE